MEAMKLKMGSDDVHLHTIIKHLAASIQSSYIVLVCKLKIYTCIRSVITINNLEHMYK